ncbi:ribosomal protein S18 acetylase RimI-like enzyme [Arthrobacter sp. UYNi723]
MSTQGLELRPAAPGDFPAIARLLNNAHPMAGILASESTATVTERSEDALVIVVLNHGTIAATLTAAPAGTYYGRLARPGQMEVSRLAVDRVYQGRGIGKAMLLTFASYCQRQGVTALVGATLESMTTAQHLYESIGATRGTIPGTKARGYTLNLTGKETA